MQNRNTADKKLWGHPTIKPLNIVENLVENSSLVDGVVLDPYMGSGTTAVACMHKQRHYIGFEKEKKYFEIAQKRINEAKQQLTLF